MSPKQMTEAIQVLMDSQEVQVNQTAQAHE